MNKRPSAFAFVCSFLKAPTVTETAGACFFFSCLYDEWSQQPGVLTFSNGVVLLWRLSRQDNARFLEVAF